MKNRIVYLSVLYWVCTSLVFAQLSKGQIDSEVADFSAYISSQMSKQSDECRVQSLMLLDDINKAHQ